jgi:hypothetical protein
MTYKELIETLELISKNVGNQENKVQKKLIKIYQKLKSYYDVYDELRNDFRLEHASVDEKGNVVLNEKGDYVFSKDALKLLQKDLKDLLSKEFDYKEIDVLNPAGLEEHIYLKGWLNGVSFNEEEEDSSDVI